MTQIFELGPGDLGTPPEDEPPCDCPGCTSGLESCMWDGYKDDEEDHEPDPLDFEEQS